MIIALFANTKKRLALDVAIQVRDFLQQHHIEVVAREDIAASLSVPAISTIEIAKLDFIISIGGDGTILRLIHHHPDLTAPILGVNLGHLGFMTDVPTTELIASLQDLLAGAYEIQERIMMDGLCPDHQSCFAVNEIVVHRAKNPGLIDLAIHVDGCYLNTFSADGIILATPCGSTAYSLAAGGPILSPELEAFVITPICPHTISNRPIVLMPKMHIEVQYLSNYDPVEITYDGFACHSMHTKDVLRVQRSRRLFRVVKLKRTDSYATLRTKLNWSGQIRHSLLEHELE